MDDVNRDDMNREGGQNVREMVERYRAAVLRYEQLHREVNALLQRHNGDSENLSDEARTQYRELARQRDDAMNEMRILEQTLMDD